MKQFNRFLRHKQYFTQPIGGRVTFIWIAFLACCVGLVFRAWFLQVKNNEAFIERARGQQRTELKVKGKRGAIVDRNGHQLAVSALVPSLYAVTKKIKEPQVVARQLAPILGLDEAKLAKRLTKRSSFVWLKRKLRPSESEQIKLLEIEGLGFRSESKRFYPNQSVAGAVIGFAGMDGNGLEGIERDFESVLKGHELKVKGLRDALGQAALPSGSIRHTDRMGSTVELTLDTRIQQLAERALIDQVEKMDANGGVVVVMDPYSGDLLAVAQTPAFDPNQFRSSEPGDWRNRSVTDVLEPGSTIKPLLIASALDAQVVRADAIFDGHKGRLRVGRKVITDVHPEKKISLLDIIKVSSNVGAVQVAQRLGKDKWYQYLRAFGFGQKSGLALRGEQVGILRNARKWGQIHLATSSYGYGFSATPIQLVRAYSVLANGGMLVEPRLIRRILSSTGDVIEERPIRITERVISQRAALSAREGLIRVTQKGGTGTKARVDGYVVAGKTGTAYKVDPAVGGYNHDKVWASFAGFVPANNPALVIYVAVDEPKKAQYGGVVAAPIFAQIAQESLPYLGIGHTEGHLTKVAQARQRLRPSFSQVPKAWRWWVEDPKLAANREKSVVPDVLGLTLNQAINRLRERSLDLTVDGAGVVVHQSPEGGRLVPLNTPIKIELKRPSELGGVHDATP
jgi:cell division protein FtsI (penicillin-binding protein 3)